MGRFAVRVEPLDDNGACESAQPLTQEPPQLRQQPLHPQPLSPPARTGSPLQRHPALTATTRPPELTVQPPSQAAGPAVQTAMPTASASAGAATTVQGDAQPPVSNSEGLAPPPGAAPIPGAAPLASNVPLASNAPLASNVPLPGAAPSIEALMAQIMQLPADQHALRLQMMLDAHQRMAGIPNGYAPPLQSTPLPLANQSAYSSQTSLLSNTPQPAASLTPQPTYAAMVQPGTVLVPFPSSYNAMDMPVMPSPTSARVVHPGAAPMALPPGTPIPAVPAHDVLGATFGIGLQPGAICDGRAEWWTAAAAAAIATASTAAGRATASKSPATTTAASA